MLFPVDGKSLCVLIEMFPACLSCVMMDDGMIEWFSMIRMHIYCFQMIYALYMLYGVFELMK